MRKLFAIFTIILLFSPSAFAKNDEKFDVNKGGFIDFGRYVETLEINDETIPDKDAITENETFSEFEDNAIEDVAKRYEGNAVELKLDDINDGALANINNDRIFKLKINETQYKIEQSIKNENMIWDSSKSFAPSYFTNSRHMAPIPSIVNTSDLEAQISPNLKATLGQTFLYNANDTSVLFVRANESTYNIGSVISYRGDGLNLSVGSFSSSYNHASSGGAILSSDSIKLPKNTGSFVLGGAYYSNEDQDLSRNTGGLFGEYTYKRLKLNAQIGESKLKNESSYNTSIYLIPQLQITDSLSIKTRLIRNLSQETMQDELVLSYKPKNNKKDFEFEIFASNQYTDTTNIRQRIRFSTSFKI